MINDLYQHYYAMPDDIAQSILISETEHNIYLRPTHLNAKKLWLFNKLIKNLLTGKKTIIKLDQQSDYELIRDFVNEHNFEKLVFNFTHSRSNLENSLIDFQPIIVEGSVKPKKLNEALLSLYKSHEEFEIYFQSITKPRTHTQSSFIQLICNSIKLRRLLKNYSNLIPDTTKYSIKELLRIKKLIPEAIPISKGKNYFLSPFRLINPEVFNLYTKEESWTAICHELKLYESTILNTLKNLQILKDKFIYQNSASIFGLLNPFCEKLKKYYNSKQELTDEDLLKMDLLRKEFQSQISKISETIEIENITYYIEDDTILGLIYKKSESAWHKQNNKSFLDEPEEWDILGIKILKDFKHYITNSKIFRSELNDISNTNQLYLHLTKELDLIQTIRKLENYFALYYDWISYFSNLPENIFAYFDSLNLIPTDHWDHVIELAILEKQIALCNVLDFEQFQVKLNTCYSSLESYKTEIIPYINYIHEELQHHAIKKISLTEDQLDKMIGQNTSSELTLSGYYEKLDKLSNIFPIIILENIRPEYLPVYPKEIWDELINLNQLTEQECINKLKPACKRIIHIHETQSADSVFNIALIQPTPIDIINALKPHSTRESNRPILHLTTFITSNVLELFVWINSTDLVISFLPLELNQIFTSTLLSQYNCFKIDIDKDFEKLQNWLNFTTTRKKILVLENLINPYSNSIQQLYWQKHFLKSLSLAGFEIESISLNCLLNSRYHWSDFEMQDLFKVSKQIHIVSAETT
ncbi:MAG: hypothetical protein IT267_09130 [Saprospiraceae bacterium]|nr:hypothetical protein [Saprospiraceae bacterium]